MTEQYRLILDAYRKVLKGYTSSAMDFFSKPKYVTDRIAHAADIINVGAGKLAPYYNGSATDASSYEYVKTIASGIEMQTSTCHTTDHLSSSSTSDLSKLIIATTAKTMPYDGLLSASYNLTMDASSLLSRDIISSSRIRTLRTRAAVIVSMISGHHIDKVNASDIISTVSDSLISVHTALVDAQSNFASLQDMSANDLSNAIGSMTCFPTIPDAGDVSVMPRVPDTSLISCPLQDDVQVPSRPLLDFSISCGVEVQSEPAGFKDGNDVGYSTLGYVRNDTGHQMIPHVTSGTIVNVLDAIATIDSSVVLSPFGGKIESIYDDIIYYSDINDSVETKIDDYTDSIRDSYETLNYTSQFIKGHLADFVYPIMLANHGRIQMKGVNGVYGQYLKYKESYLTKMESFDDKLKSATPTDTAELANPDVIAGVLSIINDVNNGITSYARNFLNSTIDSQNNNVQITSDYNLFSYYISLLTMLNTSSISTGVIDTLYDTISKFSVRRYIAEKNTTESLIPIISGWINDITASTDAPVYIEGMQNAWNASSSLIDVSAYLHGVPHPDISDTDRDYTISSILTVYNILVNEDTVRRDNSAYIGADLKVITTDESTSLYKLLTSILDSIIVETTNVSDKTSIISKLAIIGPYGYDNLDGRLYRSYVIHGASCPVSHDPDLNPDTSRDFGYRYWLKYFGVVSAIGAADPLHWSTGLVLPTGPVMFPVIYIPIVPVRTDYGIIIIGVTLCGIWVCPFVMVANMSTSTRLLSEITLKPIKQEIRSLKSNISVSGINLKNAVIEPILRSLNEQISPITQSIADIRVKMSTARESGLKRGDVSYDDLLYDYDSKCESRYKLQQKYKSAYNYAVIDPCTNDDPDISRISAELKTDESMKDKLDSLTDKLDSTASTLPGSIYPNSVCFKGTAKRPIPLMSKATDGPSLISSREALAGIASDHSSIVMDDAGGFKYSSIAGRLNAIKTSIGTLLPIDPFPTYDKLAFDNLGFLNHSNKLTGFGSKIFGIPGQPPL